MTVTNGWNDCGNNQAQFPNGAYQGDAVIGQNYYNLNYPYPGYINGYPYYPYYQTQYLTYPIYQTDPKVIELLEAIKQLLEKK